MLCHLFNKVLEVGVYPVDWCKAIIVPVVSRGAVHSAASSYAAMRKVAGSRPILVIA